MKSFRLGLVFVIVVVIINFLTRAKTIFFYLFNIIERQTLCWGDRTRRGSGCLKDYLARMVASLELIETAL